MKLKEILPDDVRQTVHRQYWRSVLLTAGWYLLWTVSIIGYYMRAPSLRVHWSLFVFGTALLILPFIIFRFRVVVFDRVCEGEIERIKYRMMSEIPVFSEGLDRVERHETAILVVRLSNGRIRRFACRRLWRAADRCYHVGDTVRHIPFVSLPQNLTCRPEEGRLCLVCGVLSRDSRQTCVECGHSII